MFRCFVPSQSNAENPLFGGVEEGADPSNPLYGGGDGERLGGAAHHSAGVQHRAGLR